MRDLLIFCYVDSQEFDVDILYLFTIYVEKGMCGLPGSGSKIHTDLLVFLSCSGPDYYPNSTQLDVVTPLCSASHHC